MQKYTFIIFLIALNMLVTSCSKDDNATSGDADDDVPIVEVDPSYFTAANPNVTVTEVTRTLSNGSQVECYQIVTNTIPIDHPVGPWCPDHITDDASMGGIWLEDGQVYDVDGAFIQNLAIFYNDTTWHMYDADGNVYVTETLEDCINAANPNVGEAYKNFCVECIPSYISNLTQTFVIPKRPVYQSDPVFFATGPGGPGSNIPSTRGISLNGVEFSAPAPVNNILAAYTLAPFDDAGGHINVHQGYHYHAATGMSFSIEQPDGHAPLIGYALDGFGIYARLDAEGNEPADLDALRGHSDDTRGYHYHVDAAGNNNFINGLHGAYVVD
jgi:hypothetical protein